MQVDDDVTNVRLIAPDGTTDEMAPVRGIVVLAVPAAAQQVDDLVAGRGRSFDVVVVAERADGSVLTAPPDVSAWTHPALGVGVCAGDPALVSGDNVIQQPGEPLPAPGAEQPADPAAAQAAIQAALDALFAPDTELQFRLSQSDDPGGLAEVVMAVQDGVGDAQVLDATVTVTEVVFVSATEAAFSDDVFFTTDKVGAGGQTGRARLVEGGWKIARGTFCQDLAKSVACPP